VCVAGLTVITVQLVFSLWLFCQICDFGLAKWKSYSKSHTSSRTKRGGTVTHTPPEIWQDINQPRTVKYDVYSFAVLFWELITEEEPFKKGVICIIIIIVTDLYSAYYNKITKYYLTYNFTLLLGWMSPVDDTQRLDRLHKHYIQ